MRVGFVQFFPIFGGIARNIAKIVDMVRGQDADLWVLPELFATGYQFKDRAEVEVLAEPMDGVTIRTLTDQAGKLGTRFCGGFPERDGDAVYNSAFLVGPEGLEATYRKVHLFDREKELFQAGDRGFEVVDVGGVPVGMMVCFDWIFPESARTLALRGARVILHPSNLVLPHGPDAMLLRCLENRVFAVTANRIGAEARAGEALTYIGMSQVVDPRGRILVRAGRDEEVATAVEIDPDAAGDKQITSRNHLFDDRKPHFYATGEGC
ncbi:MAG: nitrilase-related carbon-nitrogen hydrolase [Pseudomonadota bacterium]